MDALKEPSPKKGIPNESLSEIEIVDEKEVVNELETTELNKIDEKCDENANKSVIELETSIVSEQVSTNSESTNIESETFTTDQSISKTGIISESKIDSETSKIGQSETGIFISESNTHSEPIKTSQSTSKTGIVKSTSLGTPILNVVSPYLKLPSDDKFAKDMCDVINFENLPNSTGKYKKICNLLKKVKSEVDRIQES